MNKFRLVAAFVVSALYGQAQYSNFAVAGFMNAQTSGAANSAVQASDINIYSQYTDKSTGITHIYFRQVVNKIEIFDATSDMHLDKNGNLVVWHNRFIVGAAQKTNATHAAVQPFAAANQVAKTVDKNLRATLSKTNASNASNEYKYLDPSVSPDPVVVKQYYKSVGEELKLIWVVNLYDPATGDGWETQVDALTGEILEKISLTVRCNPLSHNGSASHTENHFLMTGDEPTHFGKTGEGSYRVLPVPVESPNHGAFELVSGDPTSNASPFGWHDTDGVAGPDWTITRGNNVYACEDTASKNIAGFSPDGGSSLVFDYTYATHGNAKDNMPLAITNLFYWNNKLHDILYNYGFDETSGNFQANNYSKGGKEHDVVLADAQDGGGSNNANFFTPKDGLNGRMQMYLFVRTNSGKNGLTVHNGSVAGTYDAPPALFGPKLISDITGQLVLAYDSSTGYTGCKTITNNISGKIAVIYRGSSCNYTQKVMNAQVAGAKAVVVVMNNNFQPSPMPGSDTGITIPSVIISKITGDLLKTRLLANDSIYVTLEGDSNANIILDGDLDNGIISHEFGHGLSNRLTGGPDNVSCLSNAEQGGEGWSDFLSLCLTARASDTALDGRGSGTYALNQPLDSIGGRTYKYSKDMSVNPMTYNSIKSNAGVHYTGSVWCTMLYDAYLEMVKKYGFNPNFYENEIGGNNMMLQLVIDGMKIQPCSPGFVDSRNAIILADSIRNGGANKVLLWTAFARRGLGWSAKQGSALSVTDGVAATDLPPFVGVIENEKAWNSISVFPNPVSGVLHIAVPDMSDALQISLYDLTGKQVLSQSHSSATGQILLNLDSVENGVYLLQLSNGNRTYYQKVVVGE